MNDFYDRFPIVLRTALMNQTVKFPININLSYTPIKVYRGIRFVPGRKENIVKEDFLSQVERNFPGIDLNDINQYSCSCFTDVEELILAFKLPRKNKGIAIGTMYCQKGPCVEDVNGSTHIHWFLYDKVDPSEDFEVYYEKEMDRN